MAEYNENGTDQNHYFQEQPFLGVFTSKVGVADLMLALDLS